MGDYMSLGKLGQDFNDQAEQKSRFNFFKKSPGTMDNWLNYKGLTADDNSFLIAKDNSFFTEMVAIEGIGIAQLPSNQVSDVAEAFTNFLRHYLEDITIITTPFPASTTEQQIYWFNKMNRADEELNRATDDRVRRVWATRRKYSESRIKSAKAVEDQLQNQEYIMFFFGKTIRELEELLNAASQFNGPYLQFKKMSRKRKELMVFRINNMNVKV